MSRRADFTKAERLACLEQRVVTLEATLERLDADRKTFVRHAQTTARNTRRLIAENRAFRATALERASKAIREHMGEPPRNPYPEEGNGSFKVGGT